MLRRSLAARVFSRTGAVQQAPKVVEVVEGSFQRSTAKGHLAVPPIWSQQYDMGSRMSMIWWGMLALFTVHFAYWEFGFIRRTTAAHERRIEMTLSEPEGLMYCDAVLNAKIRELHRVRAAEEEDDE
ncbi:Oidioi.mRNA.OKI2018_I69.XSR.g15791.t1.cds [Oikopleura dioica]|uniref:Oidioi.mRNA.OKI2018_I69.XSR.g15791.t1.cds n=1 Tax=Oikopleura dioica TaxID=34765 RepID=A0ABN7SLC5_OIKDI|nr:Oidioi.mRNA.OKI2018_I69.XSR.g15791.t1.cds [Oikopleura dioica]